MEQINHHMKYNRRVFQERLHIIVAAGAMGYVLTSQITVIRACVYVHECGFKYGF